MSEDLHARVHIALTLFRAEKRTAWGEILVGPIENRVCFGTLYDADVYPVGANETLVVQLYAGLVITHSTDEAGAKLLLELYRVIDSDDPVEPVKQVLEFRSATRIPAGYNSQGDESMVLVDDVVLFFRATWID
jgi:hypothetical protein